MRLHRLVLYIYLFLFSFSLHAQGFIEESLFSDTYTIDPENEGNLKLSIDNTSFFRNNELEGDIVAGYSLPGFRLSPRLVFYPTSFIKLEAGLSLLKYWGADKYPNYAYRDIADWKADSYQWAFHLLPYFRAQIRPIPQINLVLGNIYGGDNHGLIEPLYNRELNLTADPKVGVQVIHDSKRVHLDTWINWESFTFKNETHNEAFTVGASAVLHIVDPKSFFYLGIPAQMIFVHRGGEIDAVPGDLISQMNAAAGFRLGFNINQPFFRNVYAEIFGAAHRYYDKGSELLAYDKGWGFHSKLSLQLWNVNFKMLYWRSGDFINLFGDPVFGNVSMVHEGRTFPYVTVFNSGLRYEQTFGRGYYLGADFDWFYNPDLRQYGDADRWLIKSGDSHSWSMGIYLRINPSLVLKKYSLSSN